MINTNHYEFSKLQKSAVLCWLATIDKEGMPNVSPKEVWRLYGDNNLIISNIASPGSIKNLERNSSACVSFIDIFVQKGYKIKGQATILKKGDATFQEKHEVLYKIAGDLYLFNSIIDITIDSISPIMAPSYFLKSDELIETKIKNAMDAYGVQLL